MANEFAELQLIVKSDSAIKAEERLRKLGAQAGRTEGRTDKLTRATGSLRGSYLMLAAGVATATYAVIRYSSAIIKADRSNIQIRNSLMFVTGSVEGVSKEMDYIVSQSEKYGQNIQKLASQYTKFSAAAKGTALEGAESRLVLEGMSAAAATLALDSEQVEGAMKALEQIMSKGTVQAEELRGQLGERIPGAFQMAARAMGVTTQQLNKMLEQGQVLSEDFLPKFSRELIKTFGGDMERKTDNLTAAMNRLGNELFLVFTNENSTFAKSFQATIENLTETIKDPSFQDSLVAFNNFLGNVIEVSGKTFGGLFGSDGLVGNIKAAGLYDLLEKDQQNMAALLGEMGSSALAQKALSRDEIVLNELKNRREVMKGMSQFDKDLVDQSIAIIEQRIKATEAAARASELVTGVTGPGAYDPGYSKTDSMKRIEDENKIKKKGLGFFDDSASRIELLEMQKAEERNFLIENREILFNDEKQFQERLLALEKQYMEQKRELEDSGLSGRLGSMRDFFSELTLINQGESKKLFEINKGFALADAVIKGAQATQTAYATGGPFPANLFAGIKTGIMAAAQVAAIESQSFSGNYATGGVLGGPHSSGDRTTFNGNAGEMVLNGRQQAKLFDMANGGGDGGGSPRVSIVQNNYGTTSAVSTTQDGQGNMLIEITTNVVRQVERKLANDFTQGQGPVNRAIEQKLLARVR